MLEAFALPHLDGQEVVSILLELLTRSVLSKEQSANFFGGVE
jgi:hypothetical protein